MIVLVIIVFFVTYAYFFGINNPLLRADIKNKIKNIDKSCQTDSDCVQYAFSACFGTGCMNKNANITEIRGEVELYIKTTIGGMMVCSYAALNCKCVDNLCVGSIR